MPLNKFNKYFLQISFLAMLLLFAQNSANAQTALEQQCFDAVQDKVAYNQAGYKKWASENIQKLCKGTTNPSATISCFQAQIKQHNDYKKATDSCQPGSVLVVPVAPTGLSSTQEKSPKSLPTSTPLSSIQENTIESPPTQTSLSTTDMNLVLSWIAAEVSAKRLPFCYRKSYQGGGIASSDGNLQGMELRKVGICKDPAMEQSGYLCYPKCKEGYGGAGPACWKRCPQGFKDIGAFCQKGAPYTRGAGYPWQFGDGLNLENATKRCEKDNGKGNCEKIGEIIYPKCRSGFKNFGANICSPECPSDFPDTGTGCQKPSYTRGEGKILDCPGALELQGLTCLGSCQKGYTRIGLTCFQNCPTQMPTTCALGCAKTEADCGIAISDMIVSPIMAAVSLATLGAASEATVAVNASKAAAQTAPKAVGIINKMKGIYASIDTKIKTLKLINNARLTASSFMKESRLVFEEFSENFEIMTSYEINKKINDNFSPKAAKEIKLEWAKHHFVLMGQTNADATFKNVLTLASVVDPSGLLAVENAFYHPMCEKDTPFPKEIKEIK